MRSKLLFLLSCVVLTVGLAAAGPVDFEQDLEGGSSVDVAEQAVPAPATTQWGMFIMVLLVMTASTAALFGGGLFGGGRLSTPTRVPRPSAQAPDEVTEPARPAKTARAAKNNPVKRTFSRQRDEARKGWNTTNRTAARSRRRRGGPGCRGVR